MPYSEHIENVSTEQPELTTDHIIGNPPGFLLRSGITMVAIVITVVLALAAFISYPDTFTAQGNLTSEKPPIDHVTQRTAVIDSIFVNSGVRVEKSDIIIAYKSEVDIDDFIILGKIVDSMMLYHSIEDFADVKLPENLNIGELNPTYIQLSIAITQLKNQLSQDLVRLNIKEQNEQIRAANYFIDYLGKEKSYLSQSHELDRLQRSRDSTLLAEGVISRADYEKSLDNYLVSEKDYVIFDNRVETHLQAIAQSRLQISKLEEEHRLRLQDIYLNIRQAIGSLNAGILEFANQNFIIAEVSGIINILPEIKQGNAIPAGTSIGTIIQEEDDEKYAEVTLPAFGMAKISVGSKAIVRLLNYPPKEFGTVHSRVEKISTLPMSDTEGNLYYNLRVTIDDTLHTTYGVDIPYKPYAPVEVEIISEDKSILSRIFEQITDILYNR